MSGAPFVLIGAPDDRGVSINNGRPGAALGPQAIRQELFPNNFIVDGGDCTIAPTQDATYEDLKEKVTDVLLRGAFPIVVGGGHDLSFGSLSAFFQKFPDAGLINVDPHFDCRPTIKEGAYSSGTPFRRLLEKGLVRGQNFIEFGYQPAKNNPDHLKFLLERGVTCLDWVTCSSGIAKNFETTLRDLSTRVPIVALTIDLDAIDAQFAPGVSAANAQGLNTEEVRAIVHTAAQNKKIRYFDLMEMNPRFDPDFRTARLAASLIELFCKTRG